MLAVGSLRLGTWRPLHTGARSTETCQLIRQLIVAPYGRRGRWQRIDIGLDPKNPSLLPQQLQSQYRAPVFMQVNTLLGLRISGHAINMQ
jgi:hypothetical protein